MYLAVVAEVSTVIAVVVGAVAAAGAWLEQCTSLTELYHCISLLTCNTYFVASIAIASFLCLVE